MQYGFVLPFGDARLAAEAAHACEQAGWDGFFVWEPVWGNDAWVCLTAAAMRTTRLRLGTMLTPISRMRPWKLASETATLDNLSGGRLILAVGLGAPDSGFAAFGEVTDRKTRAELMDEGLAILTGLWRGQPFSFAGKHYQVQPTDFMPPPPPVQQPRIPIWVVGAWPREKSMQRVVHYDGLLPQAIDPDGHARQMSVEELQAARAYVMEQRTLSTPFDIIVEGETPGDNRAAGAARVAPWEAAGATWWIETLWSLPHAEENVARIFERIKQGPPRG